MERMYEAHYSLRRALAGRFLQILGYKQFAIDWQVVAPMLPSCPRTLWKGCSVIFNF
jgi:hypothetical protein